MNKTVAIALGLGGLAALVFAGGSGGASPSTPTPPSPGPTPPQKLPITVGPTLNLKNPSGTPANNNNLLNITPVPVPGVTPVTPTPVTPTPGSGGVPGNARQTAAFNMAAAIEGNGYRQSDQAIYKAYQAAAGLTTDGFPGTNTMNALANDLQSFGSSYPFVDGYTATTVVVYPWSSSGTYDGTNAPPAEEWNR